MDLPSKDWSQKVKFEIPEQYKRIVIGCSGGADSSLLLYILNQYLLSEDRLDVEITIVTRVNDFLLQRPPAMYSQKVIYKMLELFPYNLLKGHYMFFNKPETKYDVEYKDMHYDNKNTDLTIVGETSNPKLLPQRLLDDAGFMEQRLQSRDYDDAASEWRDDGKMMVYNPFWNVDKRWIADMYDLYNIRESLFPLTWSCVAWAHKTEEFTKPCGECWWCKEREWAFGYDGVEQEFNTDQVYKNNEGTK